MYVFMSETRVVPSPSYTSTVVPAAVIEYLL